MNPMDELFREGLEGRSGQVPEDLWSKIAAAKHPAAPEDAAVDQYFADHLADRTGQVPADMWTRIAAEAAPAAAPIDDVFAAGLTELTATVPAGMWARIWSSVGPQVPAAFGHRRLLAAGLILLLLLLGGLFWLTSGPEERPATAPAATVAATDQGATAAEAAAITPEDLVREEERTTGADAGTDAVTGSPGKRQLARSPQSDQRTGSTSGETGDETTVGQPDQVAAPQPATVTNAPVALPQDIPVRSMADLFIWTREVPAALPALPGRAMAAVLPLAEEQPLLKRRTTITPATPGVIRVAPRHRFQTELLFGGAYAKQEFTALTPAQHFLRDVRSTSEYPELSYQITLRGSYKVNDRWLALGGLTYAEIRNEFESEQNINGQPTLVRTTNRIRQLEVPVLLGYRLPGQRLSVSLNAGPVVNLITSAQGRFLDPDAAQPRNLAVDGNYRRNTGVGFMTSLSTTYKIGKKEPFILLVEPFFKAYPGSFTTKGAPLKEKYWVAGLQLGVRKSF